MQKNISPILVIGLIISTIYIIINRFIVSIPDFVAIPVLLIDIVLIVVGIFRMRSK
jgi:hypothetical protein